MSRLCKVLLLVLAACEGGPSVLDREPTHLASLAFDVPAGWQRTDTSRRGVATAEWEPEDNDRNESLVVIRTELSPAVAKAGAPQLEQLLGAAQRSLARPHTTNLSPLITARGLQGARIDVAFDRPISELRMQRTHVVLAEPSGASLVHVLYTAQHPDEARVALVVHSSRRAVRSSFPMAALTGFAAPRIFLVVWQTAIVMNASVLSWPSGHSKSRDGHGARGSSPYWGTGERGHPSIRTVFA